MSCVNYKEGREEIREKKINKERDPKSILKFRLRYHWYHKKNIDKINPTLRKVTNNDRSGLHLSPKDDR
jgi:hypothetical protein